MDRFFEEKEIEIEVEGGGKLTLFMRPLKIREIPLAMRVSELRESGTEENEYLPYLIELLENSISKEIRKFPSSTLNELIEIYIDFNFAKLESVKKNRKSVYESDLAVMFDFLIQSGHSFGDIQEYTITQFKLFFDVAYHRVMKIQKGNPKDILKKMGVTEKRGKWHETSK